MKIFKIYILLFFLIILSACNSSSATKYILNNEKLIFSFKTKNGKTLTLCKDNKNKYLIYRFGTDDTIELEFPNKDNASWSKFNFSSYLRGGGIENEGMDLNYLSFQIDQTKYIVYQTYFAVNNISKVGVKVKNLNSNKTFDIVGDISSKKGSLVEFRDNTMVKSDDELYD